MTGHEWVCRSVVNPGARENTVTEVCRLCGATSAMGRNGAGARYLTGLSSPEVLPGPGFDEELARLCPETCEETSMVLVHHS